MMSLSTKAHRSDARTRRPPFSATLRSEWIKLTSLPSSALALGGILAIGLGGALFLALTLESSGVPSVPSVERTLGDVTVAMVVVGQIIAGIVGVMSVGAEYSSGAIQSTLLASPTRLRALWAKAIVSFAAVTVVSLVTVFGSWAATTPLYAQFGLDVPLSAPGALPALVGAAAYLGLCAVFGVGLGALLRSTTAGAIFVFVATLLGPVLISVLPYSLFSRVLRVALLGNAGDAMTRVGIEGAPFLDVWGGYISPQAGWLFVTAWAAAALIAGAVALKKRDA
ncbi:hypothetical protein NQ156_01955 [Microbacterium sp. zg.Y625]|uniref:hypothetical protein n=1 Tax=Microbacterium jiangjiandongii TaxID=3049071 RepID=UPI00214CE477|nr:MULTISPECIES: hypothetical protein [unclassified Microbacterium]MCR2791822.1 hypothetical protein [Microbacterium sp. zg.Y625]WIM24639.1 hypothetical protein QNO14_10865 [Microbacterium sp. zg-Y625]